MNSKNKDIPWNFLNVSKLLITLMLMILALADLITGINHSKSMETPLYNVDIYTPLLKSATFALAAVLVFLNRKNGLQASGLLFLFWLLCVICGTPQFIGEIRNVQNETADLYYPVVSYLIYFPSTVIMLILNCFADKAPRYSACAKTQNPEDGSSFLSRILFSWFDPLAWKGYRRPLKHSDLWETNFEDSAHEIISVFDKHWQASLQKHAEGATSRLTRAIFQPNAARVVFNTDSKKSNVSILPALIKTFGLTFISCSFLELLYIALVFVSPQLLGFLISFAKDEPQWKGYFYAVALFVAGSVQTVVHAQFFKRLAVVGLRVRSALIASIYRKSLRMANSAKKYHAVGEIVNLMSVDSQKFVELTPYLSMIWSAPIQIILSLYFLWQILGVSVLAGLAVMILLIPFNGLVANKIKVLQVKQMMNKDERIKLINEVLNGIKVLKLYAWEPSFEKQITNIRSREIKVLKQIAYLNAGTSFIWSCAPFLVTLVTFLLYVYIDEANILTAEVAFVSLTLFGIMRIPMSLLPMLIVYVVEASVSLKRITEFMNCEELDPDNVQHDLSETSPIVIENGTFDWGENTVLTNINLRIQKGSLTAIVGGVGSGKTSLISALLGEMTKSTGRVNTIGSIAYVSQQSWVQNATIQENILFGRPLVTELYDKIVEACALQPDFEMLSGGDKTEIGEKGLNLSGGQKQRISLARAIYTDSDIYLLDDPLSAIDSHVGKHVFDQVLGPNGLLKRKTRIFITHSITYLPQVDQIVVLEDGQVSELGTYNELVQNKGDFAEFLVQHTTETIDGNDKEPKQQLGTSASNENTQDVSYRRRSSENTSEKLNGSLERKKPIKNDEQEENLDGEKLIEEEKAETGSVKWTVYKHYLQSIGFMFGLATIVFTILFQVFNVASNFWLVEWAQDPLLYTINETDGTTNITVDTNRRSMYIGVYGALGAAQALAIFISSLALFVGSLNGSYLLHNLLLYNLMRAPCNTFYDVTPVGRILNRFSKDIDIMDNVLPMTMRGWTSCFFATLATLFVISFATPVFIAVIVPIGIIYYFVQRIYVSTSRQLQRLEAVSRPPIYSHLSETVAGAPSIRAFGELQRFIRESEIKVDNNQMCYFPNIIADRWLAVRLEMLGNFILLFAAVFAVIINNENPGLVGLSVAYALQITQTLNWFVVMSSDVEANVVAVERIKEYGEIAREAPWEVPTRVPTITWPDVGSVTFKNYGLRYRPGLDLVLKKVNLTVRGGEKVGIVGRTGAGKSTLTLALFRIIEAAEGEIIIDGIDISGIGLHALRSKLTVIPQDAVLFSGTLRLNLDPFEKYSDEEIWRTLELTHLKSFVKSLPAGLNHEITESGENLSVGQRQLVCLCRALLRKTKILVLDEATAAIDLETDDFIQKTIKSEFERCTVITIAHRLNTIMDYNRIIVLDKGSVAEFDSPTSLLLNKRSIFYGMAKDAGLI